eukprot:CAMPEP_0114118084 /NCGR_PEP_ID=MMETSP0043_2-20121206/5395_1 /TAXON_ID=464988 /ORGANISM="Hemiselmis andersenii, Strain CCMP644" /LENGTH=99 /DNA_ID=CAMNT_0001210553 /DNA_START=166 /DNA_END=461 /DNA_ORIENTATION=+
MAGAVPAGTHFVPRVVGEGGQVEGLESLAAGLPGVRWEAGELRLDDGVVVVFGGGPLGGGRGWWGVAKALVSAKERYSERVRLLLSKADMLGLHVKHAL